MAKILKNQKSPAADIEIFETGVTVPASGQVVIDPINYLYWATIEVIAELTPHINAGDIVVNDGTNDLSAADGIRYLEYADRLSVKQAGADKGKVRTELDFTGSAVLTDSGNGKTTVNVSAVNEGIFFDTFDYGESDSVGDSFVNSSITGYTSLFSTNIAMEDGEVIHAMVSTEKESNYVFSIQVVKNATKGGIGTYKGGTVIGTDLTKVAGQLDQVFYNLTGFSFNKGDRIQCYIKKDPDKAKEPAIRFYIKYNKGIGTV